MATPFGKYLLIDRIASGGMAEVFRAQMAGPAGFAKKVALKRIHPAFSGDRDFVTMFIDEARLASRLTHANIVQVFDFGEAESAYYLTMELVEGVDLAKLFQGAQAGNQPLPLPTAAYICSEVASALDYAHSQRDDAGAPLGIVHRDISPQNILCSYSGDVKLADFGIAKAAGKLHVTVTGALVGKLRYMSPEQARGQPLDGRSDIFSLGVVLYELLTGRPPFEGAGPEVLERIKNDPITPPRQLNPSIPAVLEQSILRALCREVSGRHATAALLARELRGFVHATAPGYSREDLAAFVAALAPAGSARPSTQPIGPGRQSVPGAAPPGRGQPGRAGPATAAARPGARHGDPALLPTVAGGSAAELEQEPAWTFGGGGGGAAQGGTDGTGGGRRSDGTGSYTGTQAGAWTRVSAPARVGRWIAMLLAVGALAAGAIAYQLYGPSWRGSTAGTPATDGGLARRSGGTSPAAGDAGADAGRATPEPDGRVITRGDLRLPAPADEAARQRLLVAWRARPGYRVATLAKPQPGYLLVLWAVSDGIAHQEIDSEGRLQATPLDAAMQNRLRPLELDEIAQATLDYWRQTGELPEDFAVAARTFLRQHPYAATSRMPGEPLYDATALAILFYPEAPRAQELLVRARGSLDGWESGAERLLNPALAHADAAVARLQRLDPGSRLLLALQRYHRARPAETELPLGQGRGPGSATVRLLPPSDADPLRRIRLRLSPAGSASGGALVSLAGLRLWDARNRVVEPAGLPPRVALPVAGAIDVAVDFAEPPDGADDDVLTLEVPGRAGAKRSLRVHCLPRGERRSRIAAPTGEAVRLAPATQPTTVTPPGVDGGAPVLAPDTASPGGRLPAGAAPVGDRPIPTLPGPPRPGSDVAPLVPGAGTGAPLPRGRAHADAGTGEAPRVAFDAGLP